mgnify:CR=1 FL=1
MRIEDNFAQNEVLFNNKFKNINSDKGADEKSNDMSFGDVLNGYMNDTNDKMIKADATSNSFVKGEDVSIDDVMIKNQEAALSLQFLTQTRDKLMDGYNQLARLQL